MSLRPRYSLLTLLVLTALVAGGVKLWRGPHHVLEQTKPGTEVECTYTRDWRGARVIVGPCIERWYEARSTSPVPELVGISIKYYRQGEYIPWVYTIVSANHHGFHYNANESEFESTVLEDDPLTPRERAEYEQTIRQERVKIKPQAGYGMVEHYGSPY